MQRKQVKVVLRKVVTSWMNKERRHGVYQASASTLDLYHARAISLQAPSYLFLELIEAYTYLVV